MTTPGARINTATDVFPDGSPRGYTRIEATSVLQAMGEEVMVCNVTKGWYDTDPRVEEHLEWLEAHGVTVTDEIADHVEDLFGARTFGDDVALLHSEVSEALEAYRDHGTEDATAPRETGLPKPEGVGSELADVLVRLLDTCQRYDVDLFAEWRRKVTFNWTRPARHGGRRL